MFYLTLHFLQILPKVVLRGCELLGLSLFLCPLFRYYLVFDARKHALAFGLHHSNTVFNRLENPSF